MTHESERQAGGTLKGLQSYLAASVPRAERLSCQRCDTRPSYRLVLEGEKSPIRRLLSIGNTAPLHNFGHFFRCVPLGTPHPRLAVSDASVFSFPWRRLRCAAPVTHQDQGLMTSRFVARRLPLASWMPQKTLGSLPCPIVYSVQIAWLPRGSNFDRAHGRGVAQLSHSAAGPLS
jgi:hypothetical protein